MPGPQLPAAAVPTATYGELHPGSSRVPICLHNLNAPILWKFPQKLWLGRLSLPTKCHLVVHPTRTSKESDNKPHKGWVLEALDLQGLQEWPDMRAETGQGAVA